jgi:aspartate carbamoyltransferase catalytic subunit
LKVAIVGDLLHSRVLRSNIQLLTKMGAHVWVCGPPTLIPTDIRRFGVTATSSVDEAVADADVVMLLRIQLERMEGAYFPSLREYFRVFGMTEARLQAGQAGRDDHAPRSDEPRGGDCLRSR